MSYEQEGRVPADDWHSEVETPDGHKHTLEIEDSLEYRPQRGGLPQITLPVEKSDKWSDNKFDNAKIRVWKNGERKPISTVEKRSQNESNTELIARGGVELEDPVEREVDMRPSHELVRDLISTETSLTPNVDDPETERDKDVPVQSANTQEEFRNILTAADTEPVSANYGGYISLEKTCVQKTVPDSSSAADFVDVVSDPAYNGGNAYHFTSEGDRVVWNIRFEYDVPASHVGMKIRDLVQGESNIEIRWTGDGSAQARFQKFSDPNESLKWKEIGSSGYWQPGRSYQQTIGNTLKAGQDYYLGIVATGPCDYVLDSMAVYDDRFDYSWHDPDDYNSGNYLKGPESYPDSYVFSTKEVPLGRAVTGARAECEWSTTETVTGGELRVGFRQTQDGGFIAGTKGTPVVDWDELDTPGASLQGYFILSRAGEDFSRNKFPTRGWKTQHVESFNLTAHLEDLPLTVNRNYDDSLENILNDIADRGNFLWEIAYNADDGMSLEWTKPGQRVTELNVDSSNYSIERDTSKVVQAASVYGETRPYTDYFYADVGTAVDLEHSRLQRHRETVRDINSSQEYIRGHDYKIDTQSGTITALSGGSMTDSNRYVIEYEYNTYGEYVLPGVDPSDADWLPPEDVAGLSSNAACRQVAREIVDELQDPKITAEITIPDDELGWSLVESVRVDDPITDGRALEPQTVSRHAGQTTATFGNGGSFEDMLQQMTTQLNSVTRQS